MYNMHPFLRHPFLGHNYAYYMQDFTVIFHRVILLYMCYTWS